MDDLMICAVMELFHPSCAQYELFDRKVVELEGFQITCHDVHIRDSWCMYVNVAEASLPLGVVACSLLGNEGLSLSPRMGNGSYWIL